MNMHSHHVGSGRFTSGGAMIFHQPDTEGGSGGRLHWTRNERGAFSPQSIDEVYRYATTPGSGNEAGQHAYATVRAVTRAGIKSKTDLDVSGYQHVVDTYAVRKILRSHGAAATEAPRGQTPITRTDFLALPQIVAHPDRIDDGGTSPQGRRVVHVIKDSGGEVHAVHEIRPGQRQLALLTMYRRKP